MARKPQPGGDRNAWGQVLNEFIDVAHNPDGTIKPAGVQTAVSTEVETALAVQLPPAVAQEVAAQPTVAAAAAAAVDADPRISSLISDVADVDDRVTANIVTTDVLAALRFDPADPNYGAVRGTGVSSAQRTANTEAINLAAADARAAGGTLVIRGVYETDPGIITQCNIDGSSGQLNVFGSTVGTVAFLLGSRSEWTGDLYAILPAIRNADKSAIGWDGYGVGVEITNLVSCHITMRRITNFAVNVDMTAYGTGNVYNTIAVGWLENGKVNMRLRTGDNGGWVNENLFLGGRWAHNGGEGVSVPGARHIVMTNTFQWDINNNRFDKPSIEGNVPEYHVEIIGGNDNYIVQGRWEAAPPKYRVSNGRRNLVLGGYQPASHPVQRTEANGAISNDIRDMRGGSERSFADEGGQVITNVSSDAYAVETVMQAGWQGLGYSPITNWRVRRSSYTTEHKNSTDAYARVLIDHRSSKVLIGNGTAAPTAGLSSYGATGMAISGEFLNIPATRIGFFGKAPVVKPTVSGSKGGNAALGSLIAALADLGLITDNTT